MKKIAVILLVVGLTACAPKPEEIAAAQHAKCVELGYTAGTDQYGQCRLALMALAQQHEAMQRAQWAAAAQSAQIAQLGLMMYGQAMRPAVGTASNPMYVRPCRQGSLVYC